MRTILTGDWIDRLQTLESGLVQCCVTSPPYWGLRDYGVPGQLGLERTPDEYVQRLVLGFREVRRVLKDDGTLWLNLGDSYSSYRDQTQVPQTIGAEGNSYPGHTGAHNRNPEALRSAGLKHKDLVGIPWLVAFALRADGWYLRSDIIWHKPNPMPESVTDRPTKSHEYLFLLSKQAKYYYNADAIKEPHVRIWDSNNGGSMANGYDKKARIGGHDRNVEYPVPDPLGRNKRTVWTITTSPYADAHFATFPPKLIEPCILAGSRVGDTVLDPFGGSGTTGMVAIENGRKAILIDLNPAYIKLAEKRTNTIPCPKQQPLVFT